MMLAGKSPHCCHSLSVVLRCMIQYYDEDGGIEDELHRVPPAYVFTAAAVNKIEIEKRSKIGRCSVAKSAGC